MSSTRPARAAIAAVLAFSSTAVLAQEVAAPPVAQGVAPLAATPVAPPTPAAAPAAAPVMAPSAPVVQQTASVEARLAEAVAKSEAEKSAVPVRRNASPVSRQTGEQPARLAQADRAAAPAKPAQPIEVARPVAAGQLVAPINRAEPSPIVSPDPTAAPVSNDSGQAVAVGLGGAALLLAGLAGTAIMMRRRRRTDDALIDQDSASLEPVDSVAPAPAYSAPLVAPAASPAMAHADTVPATTLDAMIAAPPSAENPFLTHAKRKRRAIALLQEREERQADIPPASPTSPVAAAGPAPDRSQTIFSFGKADGRRKGWVPGIG
ncbi:hypothetical protein WG907_03385 [Sphingobium sp. AN558]|uniref:hypothetical protein n=1 Tax=Sphingobium sp. AN558 TaxID=3133442 RepID=UPI0030BDC640